MQKLGALVRSPEKLLSAPKHSPEEMAWATKMAAMLFGSYPNAKAHDPEVFTFQVTRIFLKYEPQVVRHVVETLPLEVHKGWDGLPTLHRISESCEARAGFLSREQEREERIERQLAERKREQSIHRPTYEELRERCAQAGLYIGQSDRPPPLTARELDEFRAKHGLSQADWDAIPEANA